MVSDTVEAVLAAEQEAEEKIQAARQKARDDLSACKEQAKERREAALRETMELAAKQREDNRQAVDAVIAEGHQKAGEAAETLRKSVANRQADAVAAAMKILCE